MPTWCIVLVSMTCPDPLEPTLLHLIDRVCFDTPVGSVHVLYRKRTDNIPSTVLRHQALFRPIGCFLHQILMREQADLHGMDMWC